MFVFSEQELINTVLKLLCEGGMFNLFFQQRIKLLETNNTAEMYNFDNYPHMLVETNSNDIEVLVNFVVSHFSNSKCSNKRALYWEFMKHLDLQTNHQSDSDHPVFRFNSSAMRVDLKSFAKKHKHFKMQSGDLTSSLQKKKNLMVKAFSFYHKLFELPHRSDLEDYLTCSGEFIHIDRQFVVDYFGDEHLNNSVKKDLEKIWAFIGGCSINSPTVSLPTMSASLIDNISMFEQRLALFCDALEVAFAIARDAALNLTDAFRIGPQGFILRYLQSVFLPSGCFFSIKKNVCYFLENEFELWNSGGLEKFVELFVQKSFNRRLELERRLQKTFHRVEIERIEEGECQTAKHVQTIKKLFWNTASIDFFSCYPSLQLAASLTLQNVDIVSTKFLKEIFNKFTESESEFLNIFDRMLISKNITIYLANHVNSNSETAYNFRCFGNMLAPTLNNVKSVLSVLKNCQDDKQLLVFVYANKDFIENDIYLNLLKTLIDERKQLKSISRARQLDVKHKLNNLYGVLGSFNSHHECAALGFATRLLNKRNMQILCHLFEVYYILACESRAASYSHFGPEEFVAAHATLNWYEKNVVLEEREGGLPPPPSLSRRPSIILYIDTDGLKFENVDHLKQLEINIIVQKCINFLDLLHKQDVLKVETNFDFHAIILFNKNRFIEYDCKNFRDFLKKNERNNNFYVDIEIESLSLPAFIHRAVKRQISFPEEVLIDFQNLAGVKLSGFEKIPVAFQHIINYLSSLIFLTENLRNIEPINVNVNSLILDIFFFLMACPVEDLTLQSGKRNETVFFEKVEFLNNARPLGLCLQKKYNPFVKERSSINFALMFLAYRKYFLDFFSVLLNISLTGELFEEVVLELYHFWRKGNFTTIVPYKYMEFYLNGSNAKTSYSQELREYFRKFPISSVKETNWFSKYCIYTHKNKYADEEAIFIFLLCLTNLC